MHFNPRRIRRPLFLATPGANSAWCQLWVIKEVVVEVRKYVRRRGKDRLYCSRLVEVLDEEGEGKGKK